MSELKPLKPLERIRLWLWVNTGLVGWLLLGGVTLILGLAAFLGLPIGPSTQTPAAIVGTLPLQAKASGPLGFVKLADGRVHGLRLRPGNLCKVGDVVTVSSTPRRWGISHAIEPFGCNA